jgi:hypothetical protein
MQTAELCGHGAGRQALDLKIRKPPRKPRTTGPASQLRNLLKPRFETLKKPDAKQDRSKMPEKTENA